MKLSYVLAAAVAFAAIPGRVLAADDTMNQGIDGADVDVETRESERYEDMSDEGIGGSNTSTTGTTGMQGDTSGITAAPATNDNIRVENNIDVDADRRDRKEDKNDNRGISVGLLGGVEGYSGSLAPRIDPGGAWGVLVGLKPSNYVGLEAAYSGAANQLETGPGLDANAGTLVRNGGNVNVKLSLSPTRVEPYVFGGIGMSRYDLNGQGDDVNINNAQDYVGQVPVGAGLNFHLGKFTAGARASYNMLFDREFGVEGDRNSLGIDRKESGDFWNGTIQLGTTFF